MVENCLLYYITDRSAFAGDERTRQIRLLDKIAEAASCGVDYIQLREKDLPARELEMLAREAVRAVHQLTTGLQSATALLINSRTDVALAVQADGVHLRSDDVSPEDVRAAWQRAGAPHEGSCGAGTPARELSAKNPLIAVSCHAAQEVKQAAANHAAFAVFAPVFEKKNAPASGLEALQEACRTTIPVLALGGVTMQNAESCLRAGAAGVAGIRLFQDNDVATVVRALRG